MTFEEFEAKLANFPIAYQVRVRRMVRAQYYLQKKDWKNARKWCQLSDSMNAYYAARRLDRFDKQHGIE